MLRPGLKTKTNGGKEGGELCRQTVGMDVGMDGSRGRRAMQIGRKGPDLASEVAAWLQALADPKETEGPGTEGLQLPGPLRPDKE